MNSFKNQSKLKAITFSFDDGTTQDIRLIELLNKYNLKATFNLNSGLLLDNNGILLCDDEKISRYKRMSHYKIQPKDVKFVYEGHEVASHTLTHPYLPLLDKEEIIRQVNEDCENLSSLVGYDIVGMAYPGGGQNSNEDIGEIIKNNTNVRYCRTVTSTYNFEPQSNLYLFNPTLHTSNDADKLMDLAEEFVNLKTDTPKIFYIWGHAYEMDFDAHIWQRLEEFFKLISNKGDIFYGTNAEVLL